MHTAMFIKEMEVGKEEEQATIYVYT